MTGTSLFFPENIRYRFFSRKNGVSEGSFSSLNCSVKVGDDPAKVRENMRRVAGNLGCTVEKLFVLHQTHSSIVIPVTTKEPFEKTPYGDALVTNQPHLFLGVKTADCAPVLMADPGKGVIAAAHAGWRGVVGGILENTIKTMVDMGAKIQNIIALIGPCIAPQSYEVGEDMKKEFLEEDKKASLFFVPAGTGKYRFDLPGYVLARLEHAGIGAAEWVDEDTYALEKDYFSYRRSAQKGESCGRQISVIGLSDGALF
ncbi:MAG: peptidoglycan editing factor PgeF [Alphaproteobacteria bacterium]|nr:peptidoglycan editing factor PgeF [Alphaproteobacteria bacterium]MBO4643581.1 peptidoglycan editing factor PgeF [Alphaproteobacteria bacterium]